jgi:hypothetical protein
MLPLKRSKPDPGAGALQVPGGVRYSTLRIDARSEVCQ